MREKKILVTGGSGLVGNAFKKYENCILLSSSDCDLKDSETFDKIVKQTKPDAIIHLAAKVGGVKGNMNDQHAFFYDNLKINDTVLHCAHNNNIEFVVSMLSTCIYPANKFPYTESNLHEGEPHNSNFGYAYSKRMLDVSSRIFRQQFGRKYICVVPNNIFGENDNFDLENGHVIPSIIRKVYEGTLDANKQVILWGNGRPLREFTYSHDISKSIMKILVTLINEAPHLSLNDLETKYAVINIGSQAEYSIRFVTEKICEILQYDFNKIIWNENEPMGVYRKPSNNIKFQTYFMEPNNWYSDFDVALYSTCEWFKNTYPNVRGIDK